MPIQCFARCLFSKTSKIKPNLCKICERDDRDNDAMSKKLKSDVLPLTCQFNASLDTNCWKVNLCLDEDSAQNEGIRNNQIFRNCLKPKSSTKKTVLVLVKTSTKLNEQAKWGTLCNM